MRLVYETDEMAFATAMMINELAIWRMFGRGQLTAELRDVMLSELAKISHEEIAADLAAEDRAAAPK